jgi:hypothetical protein
MRVSKIVARVCSRCLPLVHAARWMAIAVVVESIIQSGRLSLSAIGRATLGRGRPKHNIKRVDRLLGNAHLRGEQWLFFEAISAWLVGNLARPVVLVDWTKVADDLHALVAAVPIGGRALPIYSEVHWERHLGNHRVHVRFLKALKAILPPGCEPIIVTDAGFQGPFFREVLSHGWHFLGRLRGSGKARFPTVATPITREHLYDMATTTPRDLGECRLYTWSRSLDARLVLVRAKRKPGPKTQRPCRTAAQAVYRAGGRDPWLLATSLTDVTAEQVVSAYALRMKIEETFRDAKNHRFGWSLRHVRCYSPHRMANLLLLTTLAIIAVTVLGFEAERHQLHRHYQANTVKHRVLSFFVLGLAVLRRGEHEPFLYRQALAEMLTAFRQQLRAVALECGALRFVGIS